MKTSRLHRGIAHPRHRPLVFYLLLLNVTLATGWGVMILLTILGPLRHLSSLVVWVAIISYYANCMANFATASGLYSSLVAHRVGEEVNEQT